MTPSLRRSSRIEGRQQTPRRVQASPDLNEEDSERDAIPIKQKPKNASKRRKVEGKPSNKASEGANLPVEAADDIAREFQPSKPDKRVRGRRGLLRLMAEMPLDTLHEIFRELEPVDLLHLSWASKSLNSIIMEKSARYLWEEAFERLYKTEKPLPPCPDDINFAQYTRLLFEKNCMLCGSVHGYYTSWMMRLRACWGCLDSDQFKGGLRYNDNSYLLTINAKKQVFCFYDAWVETAGKPDALLVDRKKLRFYRKIGTESFEAWQRNRSQDRRDELHQRWLERKAAILSKLAEHGWTVPRIEEIAPYPIGDHLPEFYREKAKKLTNGEWKELEPELLRRLKMFHDAHLHKQELQRLERLRGRWQAFEGRFYVWIACQTLEYYWRPHALDIAVLEPLRSIIFTSDLKYPDFDIEEIDRTAKSWIDSRNDFLWSLVPQDVHATLVAVAEKGDNDKFLFPNLACLVFKSSHQSYGELCTTYDVCDYRSPRRNTSSEIASEEEEIRKAMEQCRIDYRPWAWDYRGMEWEFNEKAYLIAKDVIKHFGLDPLKTTVSQMLDCDLRFECTHCPPSSWCFGSKMTWRQIVDHEMRYEGDLPISTRWANKTPRRESQIPDKAPESSG
ncbi:hypothetical protein D9756_001343 [Leucocoprinus leucothites]|uniref:F-box domain-containing protein n=1 Tax=Leucocoprinus leucothites TaxID=201217 RepID=A0A8H5G526_9AGAR|nr:hypothetical protein D9756_001343 [Leucoagaricus leucothites]